jgi:hypothetical protein
MSGCCGGEVLRDGDQTLRKALTTKDTKDTKVSRRAVRKANRVLVREFSRKAFTAESEGLAEGDGEDFSAMDLEKSFNHKGH